MRAKTLAAWWTDWFDPRDPDLLTLRYGQLMHVMRTGQSALVSSLGTVFAIAAIAAIWHDLTRVLIFTAAGTICSVVAHILFLRAAEEAKSEATYRAANAYYMAHSVFVVAAMAVVGVVWIPGDLAPNVFVMLVLVVCATVRVAHQAAHLPSATLSLIYFAVGIGLCLSEWTGLYALLVVLALVVSLMLADFAWRMCATVEAMLKLGQSERRLIAEQQRLVGELRQASNAKSQFMARMSHELRTPLNSVIGFSDVILGEASGPIGAPIYVEYLKHINDSGTHLLRLINDILDLSKIEAGRYVLREGMVEARDAVDDAIAMLHLKAEEGGVTLVNAVASGLVLSADELAVRQIAINLTSNAVKFTPTGGTVTWRSELRANGAVALHVEDTGCGIPPEDLDWVFEPFGQSANSYDARERGTGLGLPIVRSLMELHGGQAEISSIVGKGTTVTIVFPAARSHAARKAA